MLDDSAQILKSGSVLHSAVLPNSTYDTCRFSHSSHIGTTDILPFTQCIAGAWVMANVGLVSFQTNSTFFVGTILAARLKVKAPELNEECVIMPAFRLLPQCRYVVRTL